VISRKSSDGPVYEIRERRTESAGTQKHSAAMRRLPKLKRMLNAEKKEQS